MRRVLLVAAAVALVLVPAAPSRAADRLQLATLDSAALGRPTNVRVLLPADYATSHKRYPVLLLLHGAGDDETTWTNNTDVEALTAGLDLIVVMPEGGKNANAGWYSNWVNGPQWESYHIGELVPWVKANYRTAAWGVAGLSMGGYGAMEYASRHPDLFAVAGSFSGAVDNADGGPVEAEGYGALHDRFGTPTSDVWGDYTTSEITWRDHNPADLAGNMAGHVVPWLETGTGVPMPPEDSPNDSPAEAAMHAENLEFQARTGITVHDRGYGVHSWKYFQLGLHEFLPVAMPILASPPPASPSFSYQSAEPAFSVFDWSFAADRGGVKEFLKADVAPGRLTLTGSGTVHVVTAPLFTPGVKYSTTGGEAIEADDAGRLAYNVVLGPAHQYDQYTVMGRTEQPEQATVEIVPLATQ